MDDYGNKVSEDFLSFYRQSQAAPKKEKKKKEKRDIQI